MVDKDHTRPPSSQPAQSDHLAHPRAQHTGKVQELFRDTNLAGTELSLVSARDLTRLRRESLEYCSAQFEYCSLFRRYRHLQFGRGADLVVGLRLRVYKTNGWRDFFFYFWFAGETVNLFWVALKFVDFWNLEKQLCHFVQRWLNPRGEVCKLGVHQVAAGQGQFGDVQLRANQLKTSRRSVKNVVQAIKWLMAIDIFITSDV